MLIKQGMAVFEGYLGSLISFNPYFLDIDFWLAYILYLVLVCILWFLVWMAFFCAEILFQGGWNISLSSIHCKGFHFSVILLRRVLRTRANEAGLLLVLKITKEGWSVPTFTVLQSQFIVVIKDWQNVLVFVCLLTCSSEQIKLHLISMLLCKEFALAVSSLPHLPPPPKKSRDRSMFEVFFFYHRVELYKMRQQCSC